MTLPCCASFRNSSSDGVNSVFIQLERKVARIFLPLGVRTDSGWNCTPYNGNSRWRSAMISPSSLSAVISKHAGNEFRSTTSEWYRPASNGFDKSEKSALRSEEHTSELQSPDH